MLWIEFVLLGVFAGLIAGLLGVGGGLVIVPVMYALLVDSLQTPQLMHICIATSLTSIIVTSISSIRAHHAKKAIDFSIVKQFTPGLMLGAICASFVANYISNQWLKWIFGVFELLVALRMLFALPITRCVAWPKTSAIAWVSSFIGFISGVIGIGGGTLSVPFLNYFGVPMAKAIATSAACGLPIAVAGAFGYVFLAGTEPSALPEYSFGYIYLPALGLITLASVLTAPIGVFFAHRLPAIVLKRIFAMFLAVMGLHLLFHS